MWLENLKQLKTIGFSILSIYRKTEYFVGVSTDFEKNSKNGNIVLMHNCIMN